MGRRRLPRFIAPNIPQIPSSFWRKVMTRVLYCDGCGYAVDGMDWKTPVDGRPRGLFLQANNSGSIFVMNAKRVVGWTLKRPFGAKRMKLLRNGGWLTGLRVYV
jgi:hypothetical protein